MSNIGHKESKLAPIFDIKTNKSRDNVKNRSENKLKRKRKASKNENKKKSIKRLDSNCDQNEETTDCRRSTRLRDKIVNNEEKICYNEDIDEEFTCDQKAEDFEDNIENKLNESIDLIEENSNTIDYWNELKSENNNEDDIQIIGSIDKSTTDSQEVKSNHVIEVQKPPLLWTEKYKPMNGSEVIGHKVAVNRLKSWLEDWNKCVSNKEESDREDSNSGSCLDESNACLLICGPTGAGKTSMVYAIAEELKYEVLELNASMKRNGRIISKILGEATQSHHMQKNNESNGMAMNTIHSFFTSIARNQNPTENVVKTGKQNKKSKPKGILNYFSKQNSTENSSNSNEIQIIDSKQTNNKIENSLKNDSLLNTSQSTDNSIVLPKALSFATNSLILFDDIDVIDEDSNGFWSAFNRINAITKKPVILTTTRFVPYIKECVNRLQVLPLNKPNDCQTVEALKCIFEKEVEECSEDVCESVCQYLVTTYDNDIRRCVNELQFGSSDWQDLTRCEPEITETLVDDNPLLIPDYENLIFSDIMSKNFNILSVSENRDLWMNCSTKFIENDSQSRCLAKDIMDSVNELSYKSIHNLHSFKNSVEYPIDCETIDDIMRYLPSNTSLKNILLDYCPYLSFICESESIRQSELANHSRKSRRFLHHLDSIGFIVENMVKTKLITAFVSDPSLVSEESENDNKEVVPLIDDDFYD